MGAGGAGLDWTMMDLRYYYITTLLHYYTEGRVDWSLDGQLCLRMGQGRVGGLDADSRREKGREYKHLRYSSS